MALSCFGKNLDRNETRLQTPTDSPVHRGCTVFDQYSNHFGVEDAGHDLIRGLMPPK